MEPDISDDIVGWFHNNTDNEARHEVLKRIFNVLPDGDFTKCFSLISKVKKSRKRVADEALKYPGGSRSARLSSAPLPLGKVGWLSNYTKEDVVSIDVEKVQVPRGNGKFVQKAGIISVVDHNGCQLYYSKIRRPRGTFVVNWKTLSLNGITETSLEGPECEDAEMAYSKLREVLSEKLIVGVALENDFNTFEDIPLGMFKSFDLQYYYYNLSFSTYGRRIEEPIGLRSLVWHFFHEDMQPNNVPHDPTKDAQWTLRLFLEIYCKLDPPPDVMRSLDGCNEISRFTG